MFSYFMRTTQVLIAAFVLPVTSAHAAAIAWDDGGGDNLWTTGTNWDPDLAGAPGAADDVSIHAGTGVSDRALIDATASVNTLLIGGGGSTFPTVGAGHLDIQNDLAVMTKFYTYSGAADIVHTAGKLTTDVFALGERATPSTTYVISGTAELEVASEIEISRGYQNSTVEFYQQGGTVDFLATQARIGGSQTGTNSVAIYDMSDGSFSANTLTVGWKSSGNEFRQSGGTSTISTFNIANDTNDDGQGTGVLSDAAQMTITGNVTVGGSEISDGGYGTLVLDGSRSGSGTDMTIGGSLNIAERGVLNVVVDQDAITLSDNMRSIMVSSNLNLANGASILPEFDALVTPTAGSWTILEWDGSLSDSGFQLSGATAAGWSYDLDASAKTLTVTYVVPEPSTFILLGIATLFVGGAQRRSGSKDND